MRETELPVSDPDCKPDHCNHHLGIVDVEVRVTVGTVNNDHGESVTGILHGRIVEVDSHPCIDKNLDVPLLDSVVAIGRVPWDLGVVEQDLEAFSVEVMSLDLEGNNPVYRNDSPVGDWLGHVGVLQGEVLAPCYNGLGSVKTFQKCSPEKVVDV